MKFVNPIFKTKKVRQYIADLINDYDYDNFSDLSHSDKCEFAALLIEAAGRDGEHECVVESNDLDQIIGHLKKALTGTHDDDENLVFIMKDAAVRYYTDTMHELFYEGLNDYECERREWMDYVAKHGDPDEAYDRYREGL